MPSLRGLTPTARDLYSPSCREGVFPETELPAYGVLGTSGTQQPTPPGTSKVLIVVSNHAL
jgi:hypothetical protein